MFQRKVGDSSCLKTEAESNKGMLSVKTECSKNLHEKVHEKTGPQSLEKVGFTSFFPPFAGLDVLIQRKSTTKHSLSNQTLYWSNVAL